MGKVVVGLGFIGLVLAAIVGWVMNVVQVIGLALADAPINALFVIKCVGILIAPLGAVLGYVG